MALLAEQFDALCLDPAFVDRDRSVPVEKLGGFLALESPRAGDLRRALLARGVFTDHRDTTLRMGPAPYLSDLTDRGRNRDAGVRWPDPHEFQAPRFPHP